MSKNWDKRTAALAAEYAVAAELCRRSWLAHVLPRGWAKHDVLAINQEGRTLWIQIKSTRRSKDVFAPAGDRPSDCVFVQADDNLRFFVVPGAEVARLRDQATADYLKDYPKSKIIETIRWDQLKSWEDRWEILPEAKGA